MQWRRRRKVRYVIGSAHRSLLISHYRLPFPGEPSEDAARGTNEPADTQSDQIEWDHGVGDSSRHSTEGAGVETPECELEIQENPEGSCHGCFVNGLWIPASELPNFSPCQPPHAVPGYPFLFPAGLCHTPYPRFRTLHAPDVPLFPNHFIPSDPHYYFYLVRPQLQEKAPDPYDGPSPYLQAMNMPWGGRASSNEDGEADDQCPAQYVYPGFTFGPSVYGTQTFLPPPQITPLPVFVNSASQRRRRRKRRGRTEGESDCSADNYSQITTRSYDALRQTQRAKSKVTSSSSEKTQTEQGNENSTILVLENDQSSINYSDVINHMADNLTKQAMLEAQEEMMNKGKNSGFQTTDAQDDFSLQISKNVQSSHHALFSNTIQSLAETRSNEFNSNSLNEDSRQQVTMFNKCPIQENFTVHDESITTTEESKNSMTQPSKDIILNSAKNNCYNPDLKVVNFQYVSDSQSIHDLDKYITNSLKEPNSHTNETDFLLQSQIKNTATSSSNNKEEHPLSTETLSTVNSMPTSSSSSSLNSGSLTSSPELECLLNRVLPSKENNREICEKKEYNSSDRTITQISSSKKLIQRIAASSAPNVESIYSLDDHSPITFSTSLETSNMINLNHINPNNTDLQKNQNPEKEVRKSNEDKTMQQTAISYGTNHIFEVTRVATPVEREIEKENRSVGHIEIGKDNASLQKVGEEEQSSSFSYLSEALIRETELELNRYQQLTARTSLQTTQSLYKLAYDECLTDQSETDDSDSSVPSLKKSLPDIHQQKIKRRQSEINVHEVDSTSDAGSEDVELLPHRYESQTIENKHIYVNKLSLAAELLKTKENLPYDKEFKRVIDEDQMPGNNAKEMRSVLEDYYNFQSKPIYNKQPRSIGADNPAFMEDSINAEECHRISRVSAADSGVQSDDSEEEIGQEAKEETEKCSSSNSEEMNSFQSSNGYRRFGAAHKLPFVATNKGALPPCWCCVIM